MNDDTARQIVKTMLLKEDLTMTQLVERLNLAYPDNQTAVANLNNKLTRNTIKFREMQQICDVLGYDMNFNKVSEAEFMKRAFNYATKAAGVSAEFIHELAEGLNVDPIPLPRVSRDGSLFVREDPGVYSKNSETSNIEPFTLEIDLEDRKDQRRVDRIQKVGRTLNEFLNPEKGRRGSRKPVGQDAVKGSETEDKKD